MVEELFDHEHYDENMLMIETNLDDMPGEWMGYVLERLLELGAKDAYYTPIFMKKNRPAQKLSVLLSIDKLDVISDLIFKETTTLGLRYFPVTCHRLERRFFKVQMGEWGEIAVKAGYQEGKLVQLAPEYEDCAKVAKEWGIPLKEVYDQVKKQAMNQLVAF